MPRSLQDILDHADELADAFEAWDPTPDQERPPTPEMLLRRAAWKRAEAERQLADAVVKAREVGVAWTAVGEALGTSAQAAQKRYKATVHATLAEAQREAERLAREHGANEVVVPRGVGPGPKKVRAGKKAAAKKAPAAKRAPAKKAKPARRAPSRSTGQPIAAKRHSSRVVS
jgi:hypothetical protein